MQVSSYFLRNYSRDTSKVMALGFMRPEDALGAWMERMLTDFAKARLGI